MADAPFCRPCWDEGKIGQTYRLAGQPNFRCHDCKSVYHQSMFEPWEMAWKNDRDTWEEGMRAKKLGPEAEEVFKAQLDRIEKL